MSGDGHSILNTQSSTLSFHLFTTGCKANQWDSHVISERLRQAGFIQTGFSKADLFIINGCTLTNGAERDIRRFVQRCRSTKPECKIILAGCHAQVYPKNTFGADLVLGHQEKYDIAEYMEQTGVFVGEGRDFSIDEWRLRGTCGGRTRFFFKIQDGCDRFCSYCIVPFARGRSRSRPIDDILKGLGFLKDRGTKEVVLTGIDIASYRDGASGSNLSGLLSGLETADTPPRIRISSVDPMALTEEMVGLMARSGKIAPSVHLPLQSGCDRILKEMRRRYSCSQIMELIDRLKRQIPGVGIGMDVMVGFPGETDRDFEETYAFIESLDVYYLHVFPYSDRPGTKASDAQPKVLETVKKERLRKLKKLDAHKRIEFYRRFVGCSLSVIPEGKQTREGMMRGYAENYIPVYLPYQKTLENNIIKVKIRELYNNLPLGER